MLSPSPSPSNPAVDSLSTSSSYRSSFRPTLVSDYFFNDPPSPFPTDPDLSPRSPSYNDFTCSPSTSTGEREIVTTERGGGRGSIPLIESSAPGGIQVLASALPAPPPQYQSAPSHQVTITAFSTAPHAIPHATYPSSSQPSNSKGFEFTAPFELWPSNPPSSGSVTISMAVPPPAYTPMPMPMPMPMPIPEVGVVSSSGSSQSTPPSSSVAPVLSSTAPAPSTAHSHLQATLISAATGGSGSGSSGSASVAKPIQFHTSVDSGSQSGSRSGSGTSSEHPSDSSPDPPYLQAQFNTPSPAAPGQSSSSSSPSSHLHPNSAAHPHHSHYSHHSHSHHSHSHTHHSHSGHHGHSSHHHHHHHHHHREYPRSRSLSGQDGNVEYVGPFILGPILGRGCTGTVRLGTHKYTGFEVAFKIIEKKYLNSDPKLWKKVKREIAILKLIEHPHVLKLYDVLETENRLYLVLEHVKGGELFDYIVSKGRLERAEALQLTAQIVMGLEHCHAHSICHRDLKPENLLLDDKHQLKIADFGMSSLMKKDAMLKTSCGSPHYASPEIIEGNTYDAKVTDVWSIGVILYALITGSLPFDHDNIPTLLSMVTKGQYTCPAHVPDDIQHLISRMLTVDPKHRITLQEIKQHPCYKGTGYFKLQPHSLLGNNGNGNGSVSSNPPSTRYADEDEEMQPTPTPSGRSQSHAPGSHSSRRHSGMQYDEEADDEEEDDEHVLDDFNADDSPFDLVSNHRKRPRPASTRRFNSVPTSSSAPMPVPYLPRASTTAASGCGPGCEVDETVLLDLEALGLGMGGREELRAKLVRSVTEGHQSDSDGDLERIYNLLKQRRSSRLEQLAVLSPKIIPAHRFQSRSFSQRPHQSHHNMHTHANHHHNHHNNQQIHQNHHQQSQSQQQQSQQQQSHHQAHHSPQLQLAQPHLSPQLVEGGVTLIPHASPLHPPNHFVNPNDYVGVCKPDESILPAAPCQYYHAISAPVPSSRSPIVIHSDGPASQSGFAGVLVNALTTSTNRGDPNVNVTAVQYGASPQPPQSVIHPSHPVSSRRYQMDPILEHSQVNIQQAALSSASAAVDAGAGIGSVSNADSIFQPGMAESASTVSSAFATPVSVPLSVESCPTTPAIMGLTHAKMMERILMRGAESEPEREIPEDQEGEREEEREARQGEREKETEGASPFIGEEDPKVRDSVSSVDLYPTPATPELGVFSLPPPHPKSMANTGRLFTPSVADGQTNENLTATVAAAAAAAAAPPVALPTSSVPAVAVSPHNDAAGSVHSDPLSDEQRRACSDGVAILDCSRLPEFPASTTPISASCTNSEVDAIGKLPMVRLNSAPATTNLSPESEANLEKVASSTAPESAVSYYAKQAGHGNLSVSVPVSPPRSPLSTSSSSNSAASAPASPRTDSPRPTKPSAFPFASSIANEFAFSPQSECSDGNTPQSVTVKTNTNTNINSVHGAATLPFAARSLFSTKSEPTGSSSGSAVGSASESGLGSFHLPSVQVVAGPAGLLQSEMAEDKNEQTRSTEKLEFEQPNVTGTSEKGGSCSPSSPGLSSSRSSSSRRKPKLSIPDDTADPSTNLSQPIVRLVQTEKTKSQQPKEKKPQTDRGQKSDSPPSEQKKASPPLAVTKPKTLNTNKISSAKARMAASSTLPPSSSSSVSSNSPPRASNSVSSPRFHRVRFDHHHPSSSSNSTSPTPIDAPCPPSPHRKKSWFSSIFARRPSLDVLRAIPRKSKTTNKFSRPGLAGVSGLYSGRSTLTLANEVRSILKKLGVKFVIRQGYLFECEYNPSPAAAAAAAAAAATSNFTPTSDASDQSTPCSSGYSSSNSTPTHAASTPAASTATVSANQSPSLSAGAPAAVSPIPAALALNSIASTSAGTPVAASSASPSASSPVVSSPASLPSPSPSPCPSSTKSKTPSSRVASLMTSPFSAGGFFSVAAPKFRRRSQSSIEETETEKRSGERRNNKAHNQIKQKLSATTQNEIAISPDGAGDANADAPLPNPSSISRSGLKSNPSSGRNSPMHNRDWLAGASSTAASAFAAMAAVVKHRRNGSSTGNSNTNSSSNTPTTSSAFHSSSRVPTASTSSSNSSSTVSPNSNVLSSGSASAFSTFSPASSTSTSPNSTASSTNGSNPSSGPGSVNGGSALSSPIFNGNGSGSIRLTVEIVQHYISPDMRCVQLHHQAGDAVTYRHLQNQIQQQLHL